MAKIFRTKNPINADKKKEIHYNKEKSFAEGEQFQEMNHKEKRALKKKLKKQMKYFIKIQKHYFPDLIDSIRNILDGRNISYITYEIEIILYVVILKNVCSITSMQEMTDAFNEDECIQNIYKILGLAEKDRLPHYITINDCLSKLNNDEIEKLRHEMIYNLIRKKSFNNARFLGQYWLIIVDATQLFSFKERHCEHCLTKTFKKGTPEEYTIYYHNVLEAKIVMGDNIIFSIASDFIENEKGNPTKQDCERNAFKRLAQSLKRMFPRLPICILGDSLYACESVFEVCKANNWEFLIRFKDGSIPTLAKDFNAFVDIGESEEDVIIEAQLYKRKPEVSATHRMKWVNDMDYNGYSVTILGLEIEFPDKKWKEFQWISSQEITNKTAKEFADTGRKRWMIENEGFKVQKNHRYIITHANSLNYNAMKNHYLLTQLADILLQLYENGVEGLKLIKRTIAAISEGLLNSLQMQILTDEDLLIERIQVRRNTT